MDSILDLILKTFMWNKMDQKYTKGYKCQVSEAEHQGSRNNTEVQIGKHRPIRYGRNQLLAINYDTHRIRLNGNTVINVRRLRINKRHGGKGGVIRLNYNDRWELRIHNSLNLNNLVQVSLQNAVVTTIVVSLSTMNTQSLKNKEYVVLEDFITNSVDLSVLTDT